MDLNPGGEGEELRGSEGSLGAACWVKMVLQGRNKGAVTSGTHGCPLTQ